MATEMKNAAVPEAASAPDEDLDPKALAAIRDLLSAEEEPAPAAPAAPPQKAAPAQTTVRAAPASDPQPRVKMRENPAPPMPETEVKTPKPKAQETYEAAGFIERLKARVTGYRPTPKHIVLAAIALLVLLRPWLVIGILLLFIFATVCVFLILGYDGFWKRAMGLGRWYARKRPSRAAELHRKLDDFAMKWDAVLDRFPEGTVDGLYLPDFGDLATADARHDEAMDRRLSSLQEKQV